MEDNHTHVRAMRLKTGGLKEPERKVPEKKDVEKHAKRTQNSSEDIAGSTAVLTTYERETPRGGRILALDKLLRNVAVVGAMLLVIVAIRNIDSPQSQSVFAALQSSTNMEWDESLGKLSFVSNLLPSSVQAVWGEQESISVLAPVSGEIVHAWSQAEPYLEMLSAVEDVRAVANGEIMAVAHGLDEEFIVRLRHDDSTESIYGNLAVCHMDVGDYVFQGDIIATVLQGKPLAFELRKDGRSIDPKGKLQSLTD